MPQSHETIYQPHLTLAELKKIKQDKLKSTRKPKQNLVEEQPPTVFKRSFSDMPYSKDFGMGEIRLMTFNVLAQGLIKRELFPDSGDILKWKTRRNMIIGEIKYYDPDILAMQELSNFEQYYQEVFTNIGYKTKYTKFETKSHGCGIAYKKDKFNFIDFKTINYDTDTTSTPFTETGNVGQLLALQLSNNPKVYFVIGNTHLYWKPSADYERLRQTLIISNQLLEFKASLVKNQGEEEEKWIPLLLGDFNTWPEEAAYRLLTNKKLIDRAQMQALDKSRNSESLDSTEGLVGKHIPCQWHSIYSDYHTINSNQEEQGICGEPKFTNYTVAHKGILDYMFIDKEAQVSIKRILAMPKEDLLKPSLPNKNFGSDHLCLAADIEF